MPDQRHHRGPHPEDRRLFAPDQVPALRAASSDYCWLLDRGYAPVSSLKLVGDRYALAKRQRIAIGRCGCSRGHVKVRRQKELSTEELLAGWELWIDGYNVLTSIEAALAGGIMLQARDGCFRDMASMHGSYRKVAETLPALRTIGQHLAMWRVERAHWLLDRPVSNSGRLRRMIEEVAAEADWPWNVELVLNPDAELMAISGVVASSDSQVLDGCQRWVNVVRRIVEGNLPQAHVVDLSC